MAEKKHPYEWCPSCDCANLKKFDKLWDGIGAECLTEKEIADYQAGKPDTEIYSNCGQYH